VAPNLLLVVFDTARADAFEPWGAPIGATPTVADLAALGTAFPFVVAPSNWTLPSHASMFTGMLPGVLGLTSGTKTGSKAGMNSRTLLEEHSHRVLASVLRDRGYDTKAVSTNPWIHEVNGFGTGFDEFLNIKGHDRRHLGSGARTRIDWALDAWRARVDDGATNAAGTLRRWMDERAGRPFFWFVNLMECHSPYLPPRPYNDLPGLDRIRAARDAARYQSPQGIYRVCVGHLRMNSETLSRTRHLYARAIRQMDDWLAAILGELDRRRVLDDTIVVLASDHGENLGEDGLIGHMLSMSERLLRVPLVFSRPVDASRKGVTSLAELPRLVAEVLGIGHHPWDDDLLPFGTAVSQVAGQVLLPEREHLARAWGVPDEAIRAIASPMTSATDGRFKLVRDASGERLYDLDQDPLEQRPIQLAGGPSPATPLETLRRAISHVESLAPARGPASEADDESADLQERLRHLGYI
jgi:arylsulfatase A-like enzyme